MSSPDIVLEKKINNKGWYDSYLYYKRTQIGFSSIEIEIGIQNPPRTWNLAIISGMHWLDAYAHFSRNNTRVNIKLFWCKFENNEDFECLGWLLSSTTTTNVILVNHHTNDKEALDIIKNKYGDKLIIKKE